MTPKQLASAVMLLVGCAVWCLARSLRRAPRSIEAARRQMYGRRSGATTGAASPRWMEGVGGSSVSLADRRFGSGLGIIGMTPADVITRVAMSAGLMFLVVTAAVVSLLALGSLPTSLWWFAGAFAVSAAAGWTMWRDIGARIERRRRELRRAANDFVQLVAVGLTTDQSVEEAIRFAVEVGAGDAFDVISREISSAPQRGVRVWEAIEWVGNTYDVRELCEFAASVERQGLHGVSIGETVASMAVAMRAKALDELEREADKANANLSGPTIGFVVATIVFLAYPLAQRISDAFGG